MSYCIRGGARLVDTKNTRVTGVGIFECIGIQMIGGVVLAFGLIFLSFTLGIALTCVIFGHMSVSCAICVGTLTTLDVFARSVFWGD